MFDCSTENLSHCSATYYKDTLSNSKGSFELGSILDTCIVVVNYSDSLLW